MAKPLVLIVDPDLQSRRVLEAGLRLGGYRVVLAEGTTSALAKLKEEAPLVVVTESRLKDGSGFELVENIRKSARHASLPVVMLASDVNVEQKLRGLSLGADEYLTKPIHAKEVVARIALMVERHRRSMLTKQIATEAATVNGFLDETSVADLVDLMVSSRRSGTLRLSRAAMQGLIAFVDGAIVHAELGKKRGAAAVQRAYVLEAGDYELSLGEFSRERTITSPTAELIEGAQRFAESWTQALDALPNRAAPLVVNERAFVESIGELPDAANAVLRECDGRRTVYDLLDVADEYDLNLASRVGELVADGVLLAASPRLSLPPSSAGDLAAVGDVIPSSELQTLAPPELQNPFLGASDEGDSAGNILTSDSPTAVFHESTAAQFGTPGMPNSSTNSNVGKQTQLGMPTATAAGHSSIKEEAKMSRKAKRKKSRSMSPASAAPESMPPQVVADAQQGNVIQFPKATRVVAAPAVAVGSAGASIAVTREQTSGKKANEARSPHKQTLVPGMLLNDDSDNPNDVATVVAAQEAMAALASKSESRASMTDSLAPFVNTGEHPEVHADFFKKGYDDLMHAPQSYADDDHDEISLAGIPTKESSARNMRIMATMAAVVVLGAIGVKFVYDQKFATSDEAPAMVQVRLPSPSTMDVAPAPSNSVVAAAPTPAAPAAAPVAAAPAPEVTPEPAQPEAVAAAPVVAQPEAVAAAPAAIAPAPVAAAPAPAPVAAAPAPAPVAATPAPAPVAVAPAPAPAPAPVAIAPAPTPAPASGDYATLLAAARRARGRRTAEAWQAAIAANPAGSEALSGYAFFLLNRGDVRVALDYAQQSVAADPTNAEGWITLGAAKQSLGDQQGARVAYRNCVQQGHGRYVSECRSMTR